MALGDAGRVHISTKRTNYKRLPNSLKTTREYFSGNLRYLSRLSQLEAHHVCFPFSGAVNFDHSARVCFEFSAMKICVEKLCSLPVWCSYWKRDCPWTRHGRSVWLSPQPFISAPGQVMKWSAVSHLSHSASGRPAGLAVGWGRSTPETRWDTAACDAGQFRSGKTKPSAAEGWEVCRLYTTWCHWELSWTGNKKIKIPPTQIDQPDYWCSETSILLVFFFF